MVVGDIFVCPHFLFGTGKLLVYYLFEPGGTLDEIQSVWISLHRKTDIDRGISLTDTAGNIGGNAFEIVLLQEGIGTPVVVGIGCCTGINANVFMIDGVSAFHFFGR